MNEDLSELSERALLVRIYHRTQHLERTMETILSNTDPLAGEIGQVQTDLTALQTQNANLVSLVQKLAAAANVNTAADLAALQAADTSVTSITAADVAAIAAQPAPPPATPGT